MPTRSGELDGDLIRTLFGSSTYVLVQPPRPPGSVKIWLADHFLTQFNQPPFNALKYELIVLRYSAVHQLHTFIEPMCLLNQRLPYELYQASLTDGELLPSRGPGLPLPPFDAPPTKRPLKSQVNPFLINIAAFCRIKRHEALEGNDSILLPRYQSLSSSVINLGGLLFWKPGGSNGGALREAGLGDKSLRELMGLLDWSAPFRLTVLPPHTFLTSSYCL